MIIVAGYVKDTLRTEVECTVSMSVQSVCSVCSLESADTEVFESDCTIVVDSSLKDFVFNHAKKNMPILAAGWRKHPNLLVGAKIYPA